MAAVFILLLCFYFQPRWETNDDVGMSMVAHGYGIASSGSPYLVFSNILWGFIVRLMPSVNGMLGYTVATYATLLCVGGALVWGLARNRLGWLVAAGLLLLLLIRPVLIPQFTINAGLLALVSVICFTVYGDSRHRTTLLVGCAFAYLGYLVRSQECVLVLFVGLPLLPWRIIKQERFAQIALISLLCLMAASSALDYWCYQSGEWRAFNEWNPVRAQITDFGAGQNLLARPDVLQKHGFTSNDISLIGVWFFVDPAITNPAVVKSMLAEAGFLPALPDVLGNLKAGFSGFSSDVLLYLVVAAASLYALWPSRRICWVLALFLIAIAAMAVAGRPGVMRVYLPLVSLLILAPLLANGMASMRREGVKGVIAIAVIYGAAGLNAAAVASQSRALAVHDAEIKRGLVGFPGETVVSWGAMFPYESAYPVKLKQAEASWLKFYSLGAFTLAPFSRAYALEHSNLGFINRLQASAGIALVANPAQIGVLTVYCHERLGGTLESLGSQAYGAVNLTRYRCVPEVDSVL
ncbi:hypothetical protein [Pseudomonas putida]